MNGSIKIPFLVILLLGIVIGAYLYVSRAEEVTNNTTTGGNSNSIDAAESVTDGANQEARQRLQDAQNELNR